ncbi:MAG: MATE family efflux transporter [Pontiella sp.]
MNNFKSDSSVLRIVKNGMFMMLRFGIGSLSAIILIPFLVKQYGSIGYGLVALGGFLTQYVGLISRSISNSVGRFLNIALNKNDWQQANEILSTAVFTNIGIICIQLPLFVLAIWKLNWLIDFPTEMMVDFRIFVGCNIAIFYIGLIEGTVFTPIVAANRLDIGAKISIFVQLIRIVLIFSLISGIGARLWIIGVVDLGIKLAVFFILLIISRKLVDHNLVCRWRFVTLKWARPILRMAGWSLFASFGFALFNKTDVWIINRFVDVELAGVYAAILVWPNFVRQIGGQFAALLGPVYTIDYAKGNMERMVYICMFSYRFLGLLSAILVGFIIVFAEDILLLWMGVDYVQYATLLKLMTCCLIVTLGETAIWGVFTAIDKMQYPGWANIVLGIVNLVLSLILVFSGFGVYGVIAGTIVSTVLKCSVILPYGIAKEMGVPFIEFLQTYIVNLAIFGLVWCLGALVHALVPGSIFGQCALFASLVLVMLPVMLRVGFTRVERNDIATRMKKVVSIIRLHHAG